MALVIYLRFQGFAAAYGKNIGVCFGRVLYDLWNKSNQHLEELNTELGQWTTRIGFARRLADKATSSMDVKIGAVQSQKATSPRVAEVESTGIPARMPPAMGFDGGSSVWTSEGGTSTLASSR